MTTFLVVHGAWSGGWAWRRPAAILTRRGHRVLTPTLTGVGERVHLAHSGVDLTLHIEDVVSVIETEELDRFVLVGHSYGGMVVTGVAARLPERVVRLVYLDAFVPCPGQSLFDLQTAANVEAFRRQANEAGGGWRIPPMPVPVDTSAEDAAWVARHRLPQPIRTFEEKLPQATETPSIPRTYIYCTRKSAGDVFRQFADAAKAASDWHYLEIDASHSPNITAPEALADLLERAAAPVG